MKTIQYNENNLEECKVDRTVRKVRGLIFNKKGEVLLCNYAGVYLLPGGSIEEGETITQAFLREAKEETGIDIDYTKVVPFLQIKSFNGNYYDRKYKKEINRLTETTIFEAKTDLDIALTDRELTESEKENGFNAKYVKIQNIPTLLQENKTNNPKVSVFNKELITVLDEYSKWKEKQKQATSKIK